MVGFAMKRVSCSADLKITKSKKKKIVILTNKKLLNTVGTA
jgi:hypothetical protein